MLQLCCGDRAFRPRDEPAERLGVQMIGSGRRTRLEHGETDPNRAIKDLNSTPTLNPTTSCGERWEGNRNRYSPNYSRPTEVVSGMDEAQRSLRERLRKALESLERPQTETLFTVSLAGHDATGKYKHWFGGKPMGKPDSLAIARVEKSPGYYLFYLDALGQWVSDTLHGSLDAAFEQANFEFGVTRDEWSAAKS